MTNINNPVKKKILIVDDDPNLLRLLGIRLSAAGYNVESAASAKIALGILKSFQPHMVISDLRMEGMDGMALFEKIRKQYPHMPVVIMTAHGTIPDAINATKQGIFSFLTKPFESQELLETVQKAIQLQPSITHNIPKESSWRANIISRSAIMETLLQQTNQVAQSDFSLLIHSASGTGKELLAKAIHQASNRHNKSFTAINCAAIPEQLLESELFGHVKGAFTGATKTTVGFFEQAEGGTLFLDEVGELPLQIQAKLLRALQEKEITLIGSAESRPVNARIITATNRDLRHAIRAGQFREDLYFRISTFRINVPGLRERSDDILPLSNFFLVKYGSGEQVPNISPDALTKLLGYDWPGNVRELENVIQRAVVLSDGKDITADHLFFDDPVYDVPATGQEVHAGFTGPVYDAPSETRSPLSDSFYGAVEGDQSRSGLQSAMDANEFRVIAETLRNSRTRKEAAARLGISERTLRYKVSRMKDRGIDIPRRKWA